MVRSAFEKDITYRDSTFYDASTWSLVHAFNMPHAEVKGSFTKGNQVKETPVRTLSPVTKSNYAYLIDITDYNAHKAIYALQTKDVIVRTGFKPFSSMVNGVEKSFPHGSIVIPVQQQRINADELFEAIRSTSAMAGVEIYSVETGLNAKGVDLGSRFNSDRERG
jgi:hypothetical protein